MGTQKAYIITAPNNFAMYDNLYPGRIRYQLRPISETLESGTARMHKTYTRTHLRVVPENILSYVRLEQL